MERERYMKPTKKRGRAAQSALASAAVTTANTPVDGVDEDAETSQNVTLEPEIVRKEHYIACEL